MTNPKSQPRQCYHNEAVIKAVFFDMYNTLAGFEPSRFEVQSRVCAEFGIELTEEGVVKGYAAADAYMTEQNISNPIRLRDSEARDRFFAEYERLVIKGSGVDVTPEQALPIWLKVMATPHKLAPFEDVVPVLQELRDRGLKVGMISNIDEDGTELARGLGLADYLDLTVTSQDVGAEKPDPAVFQAALDKAAATAVEAMHVGDQVSSDIDGALAVGISPVLLDRDGNHRGYDRCPRIESLTELPGLIDEPGA